MTVAAPTTHSPPPPSPPQSSCDMEPQDNAPITCSNDSHDDPIEKVRPAKKTKVSHHVAIEPVDQPTSQHDKVDNGAATTTTTTTTTANHILLEAGTQVMARSAGEGCVFRRGTVVEDTGHGEVTVEFQGSDNEESVPRAYVFGHKHPRAKKSEMITNKQYLCLGFDSHYRLGTLIGVRGKSYDIEIQVSQPLMFTLPLSDITKINYLN
ncbi:hypothetical protein SAMD00019534_084990 [Acytostelium subglobosum LB1]|uniref:hypothetical protein n=1 Tax=Acytostelium subglobosum LB1 TaxID=1410327 RepID=UPI000644863A|nr:hypothetical protein SAMD00019534_084990 [Acytostelium subglobosum LB1]GAM25324.1 hypothetical protein SAMD00019534_084990 [Acytostelium subglobosum LB1]|eukprot:XP_012751844.1 hypothetical protein SAMD00019534_084990 [Acytostelium subglobosum LB1]